MRKLKLNILLFLIFLIFTQGIWERMLPGFIFFQNIIDFSAILFIFLNFKFKLKNNGIVILLSIIIFSFISGIYNGNTIKEVLIYLRHIIFFYLIYIQLFELLINKDEWIKIFKFLLFLIIIQGIGSFFTYLFIGQIEGYVGLMSSIGGTTATIFPILIISLTFLTYLFLPKVDKKTIILLLSLIFSSLLVGFASGKRGIYFTIPLFLITILIISFKKLYEKKIIQKKFIYLSILFITISPLIIFGIANSKGLNYNLNGNETIIEIINKSLNYAESYESATDEYGNTTGRSNTTLRIIQKTLNNEDKILFGYGFGASNNEDINYKLGFGYGLTGFTRDIISGGWIVMILINILFIKIIYYKKSNLSSYSKILKHTLFITFIFTQLFYSSDFTTCLKISIIYAITLAFINSPIHTKEYNEIINNKLIN